MADAALSVATSPMAALLATTPADPASNTATAQAADPFATLLATAAAPKAGTNSAPIAEAVAALLATPNAATLTTEPPVALPVAATPPPVSAAALPIVDAEAALPVIKDETADDDKPTTKGDSEDPLADAIASGVNAVLALAPAIVAPVQAPAPAPLTIDVPIAATMTRKIAVLASGPHNGARLKAPPPSTANNAAATTDATTATTAPAFDATQAAAQNQQASSSAERNAPAAPTPDAAKPIAEPPSPDMMKAALAALGKGSDAAPLTPVAEPAPTAAGPDKSELAQAPKAIAQTVKDTATPAQTPVRRRSDEIAAPRRTDGTRKRVEAAADAFPVGLAQRAADTMRRAAPDLSTSAAAKGDAIVQQTLTIAQDGAWLDKLAHDIASSGGNGSDLHFKLEPQNLGALTVAISQSADGASIRMTADTDKTRNILLDAQPKLIAEARAQGLKVSDTQVDLNQNQSHNQGANQDASRWAQGNAGQNGTAHDGQNRQSSPDHQPFVSNLGRKAEAESESPDRDSNALYA